MSFKISWWVWWPHVVQPLLRKRHPFYSLKSNKLNIQYFMNEFRMILTAPTIIDWPGNNFGIVSEKEGTLLQLLRQQPQVMDLPV